MTKYDIVIITVLLKLLKDKFNINEEDFMTDEEMNALGNLVLEYEELIKNGISYQDVIDALMRHVNKVMNMQK